MDRRDLAGPVRDEAVQEADAAQHVQPVAAGERGAEQDRGDLRAGEDPVLVEQQGQSVVAGSKPVRVSQEGQTARRLVEGDGGVSAGDTTLPRSGSIPHRDKSGLATGGGHGLLPGMLGSREGCWVD